MALDLDEATVREFIGCLAVQVELDKDSGDEVAQMVHSYAFKTACRVADIFTGMSAFHIAEEARETAKQIVRNGGDWKRQIALLHSYEERYPVK